MQIEEQMELVSYLEFPVSSAGVGAPCAVGRRRRRSAAPSCRREPPSPEVSKVFPAEEHEEPNSALAVYPLAGGTSLTPLTLREAEQLPLIKRRIAQRGEGKQPSGRTETLSGKN
ncbi:hypothetical protein EYF80_054170 [Liparis tanakae]|uniref:Uncharacterized protein n=1 Tax=Liparis tanakae TaxID=230148 RepID=A0A4Z2F3N5_9TELE|nr:hypothetical protein EYF80_054170 [Liparis tanakae]